MFEEEEESEQDRERERAREKDGRRYGVRRKEDEYSLEKDPGGTAVGLAQLQQPHGTTVCVFVRACVRVCVRPRVMYEGPAASSRSSTETENEKMRGSE